MDTWEAEIARFYEEIDKLDRCLLSGPPEREHAVETLIQGPLSDALTHVGQLSMLRRISGDPLPPENFAKADIYQSR